MMEIVQFQNGKYGIRKTALWGLVKLNWFLDLTDHTFWWRNNEEYFNDCQEKDLEKVKEIYQTLNGKVKIIK